MKVFWYAAARMVNTRAVTDTANQRNAVLAGLLGWTLDAFDFFILTLVIEDLARAFFPGSPLAAAHYPGNAWRVMFFLGGLPALLSLFIRMRVKESDAWHEQRTDWVTYRSILFRNGRRFVYLILLMTAMNFMSHGTQDMYPTLLGTFGYNKARIADITMLSMIGAVIGGLLFGAYSDPSGRPRALMTAAACGLLCLPTVIPG